MTHIPSITREAREWLLSKVGKASGRGHIVAHICDRIYEMPLTPSSDLDAVRARWIIPHEYTITACDGKIVLGRNSHGNPVLWSATTGDCLTIPSVAYPLTPVSPHAALIARLNEAYITGIHDPDLYKRAADALEKLP